MSKLSNQSAIVTGGSNGYGVGIARRLAEAGAQVWITGRNSERLKQVADEIGAHAVVADITSCSDWDQVVDQVIQATGRLDILVNNAGAGIKIGELVEQTDESIEQSLTTNLTGAIFGCRRAAKVMTKQQSGIIINVGSVCAKHAWSNWSIYSAAKAGMLQFTRCLITELRPHGVRATSLIPSWGQTEFTDSCGLGSRDAEILEKCISPDDLGDVVVQLAEQPAHLLTEEITVWPMVQPMTQL